MVEPGQSVDVDRDHVDYSCNEHDQDQRHVQRVPDRKETLVGLEAGDLARGGQAVVHKLKCRRAQLFALRRYLREISGAELLSRDQEVALAQRIEAGRAVLFSALSRSPVFVTELKTWRARLAAHRWER